MSVLPELVETVAPLIVIKSTTREDKPAISVVDAPNVNVDEPKVIVVKQEVSEPIKEDSDEKNDSASTQPPPHDPYGISQNPYFAYPPDYYYEEDEEDEYED